MILLLEVNEFYNSGLIYYLLLFSHQCKFDLFQLPIYNIIMNGY